MSSSVSLTRHRWVGNPIRQLWTCTPGMPSLYRTYDPICFGCGAEIRWSEIKNLGRFTNICNDRIAAEDLGIRLDLRLCELAVDRQRGAA